MGSRWRSAAILFGVLLALHGVGGVSGAEQISLSIPGGNVRGEVLKVTKSSITLKESGTGKDREVPVVLLKPKDFYLCSKQVLDPKDAKGIFELGEYCLKHDLKDEADWELRTAAKLDTAAYGEKVTSLLAPKASEPVKAPEIVKPPEPKSKEKAVTKAADAGDDSKSSGTGEGGEFVEVTGPDGKKYKIPKRFIANHEDIKPKTPEEAKKFLAERMEELNKSCGSGWRMDELPHFFFFSNVKPQQHLEFRAEIEEFYKTIAMVMQHKEGDPLWNNKCPLYLFSNRNQFVTFAVQIDKSGGGANSGGYFSHRGREVHIAIPLIDWLPDSQKLRDAKNTLHHEGTHAFVQLTGKVATINSWLHEGMAQFMEFWYAENNNNMGRNDRVNTLRDLIRSGDILSWENGRMRPMGGMDRVGYAFAWSRVEFLYRNFADKSKLPRMIKLIKEGKSDEEALEAIYGMKVDQLEKGWEMWLKEASKFNFKP